MNFPSLARWIPALTWLRTYDRRWLRGDVLAGVTLAAYLLPAALGDASLANLGPEAGLYGVMLGVLISLVQLVRVSSRPHVALLGRIPGTRRFSDRDRHEDNELIPNVMIFRQESVLIYFNIDNVCEAILSRVQLESTPPKLVVVDLSAAPMVDIAERAYACRNDGGTYRHEHSIPRC